MASNSSVDAYRLTVSSLDIASTGYLDLNNNEMSVLYTASDPIAAIRGYIGTGYNAAAWNGYRNSRRRPPPAGRRTSTHLATVDSADGMRGLRPKPANSILIRYTLMGRYQLGSHGEFNGCRYNGTGKLSHRGPHQLGPG